MMMLPMRHAKTMQRSSSDGFLKSARRKDQNCLTGIPTRSGRVEVFFKETVCMTNIMTMPFSLS